MPAPQGQQQGSDDSLGMFWMVAGLIVVCWVVWAYFHDPIVRFIFQIRLWEIDFVAIFTDRLDPIRTFIQETPPSSVDWKVLGMVSTRVGTYLSYPIAVLLGVFAVVLYLSNNALRYRKIFSMKTLAEAGKNNWPQITPVTRLDLVAQDIRQGAWAMAQVPMRFCREHDLLAEETEGPEFVEFDPRQKKTATLLKRKAEEVFVLQLERHWTSIEALAPHRKALFAAFAARANHDPKPSEKFLEELSRSAGGGKLNFKGTMPLLKKYYNTKPVARAVSRHAYELTVMATLLMEARNDGVLPSSDFLWLKPIDRPLWFMLNSVGRQTPVCEVAGPFAHWLAERAIENNFENKLLSPLPST